MKLNESCMGGRQNKTALRKGGVCGFLSKSLSSPASQTLYIPPQTPPLTHPTQPAHYCFPCCPQYSPSLLISDLTPTFCSELLIANALNFHLLPLFSLAPSTLGARSPRRLSEATLAPGSLKATLAPLHRLRSHLCSATSCSANLLLVQCGNVLDTSRQIRLPSTGSTREPGATGALRVEQK